MCANGFKRNFLITTHCLFTSIVSMEVGESLPQSSLWVLGKINFHRHSCGVILSLRFRYKSVKRLGDNLFESLYCSLSKLLSSGLKLILPLPLLLLLFVIPTRLPFQLSTVLFIVSISAHPPQESLVFPLILRHETKSPQGVLLLLHCVT